MSRPGKNVQARLSLYIRADVLGLIGGGAKKFRLSLGRGANKHLLRVQQEEGAPFVAVEVGKAKGGGTFRLMLPPTEQFPDARVPPQGVTYEHKKGERALLITMPAWAWNNAVKADMEKRRAA
jgi:hypothetical protein